MPPENEAVGAAVDDRVRHRSGVAALTHGNHRLVADADCHEIGAVPFVGQNLYSFELAGIELFAFFPAADDHPSLVQRIIGTGSSAMDQRAFGLERKLIRHTSLLLQLHQVRDDGVLFAVLDATRRVAMRPSIFFHSVCVVERGVGEAQNAVSLPEHIARMLVGDRRIYAGRGD